MLLTIYLIIAGLILIPTIVISIKEQDGKIFANGSIAVLIVTVVTGTLSLVLGVCTEYPETTIETIPIYSVSDFDTNFVLGIGYHNSTYAYFLNIDGDHGRKIMSWYPANATEIIEIDSIPYLETEIIEYRATWGWNLRMAHISYRLFLRPCTNKSPININN